MHVKSIRDACEIFTMYVNLFDIGFYCDIVTDIHAILLVFIATLLAFIIWLYSTLQCCGNSFLHNFCSEMV